MKSKLLLTLLTLSLSISAGSLSPMQASAYSTPEITNNIDTNDYGYYNWAHPVSSYLISNDNGTLSKIENCNGHLSVENYTSDFKFINGLNIPMQLNKFGGFYEGKNYYYIVFGQDNKEESENKEVYRIVKYDKNFNEINSASVYGGESCTTVPFEAGSLRMTESDGNLIVHTGRKMFKSEDGLNHQSNYTICVDTDTMDVSIPNGKFGSSLYTSHSFNQFILNDNDNIITVDQGDAYPRALILQKTTADGLFNHDCTRVNLLKIKGNIGDNYTGVTVGGLEKSKNNYLTCGTTIPQNNNSDKTTNVFIASVPRNDLDDSNVELKYITNYKNSDNVKAGTPQIVKVSSNSFIVLWKEGNNTLKYASINGSGNLTSEIKSFNGNLSDCNPIISNGNIIWYVTESSSPIFYKLNPETMQILKINTSSAYSQANNSVSNLNTGENNYTADNSQKIQNSDNYNTTYKNQNNGNAMGWTFIDNNWYFLDTSGAKVEGWLYYDNKTYFLIPRLGMAKGWYNDCGSWYYFNEDGSMYTGWIYIDGYWYYLKPNGVMAANEYIDGYYLSASGALLK